MGRWMKICPSSRLEWVRRVRIPASRPNKHLQKPTCQELTLAVSERFARLRGAHVFRHVGFCWVSLGSAFGHKFAPIALRHHLRAALSPGTFRLRAESVLGRPGRAPPGRFMLAGAGRDHATGAPAPSPSRFPSIARSDTLNSISAKAYRRGVSQLVNKLSPNPQLRTRNSWPSGVPSAHVQRESRVSY